jgi:hypothetical protein
VNRIIKWGLVPGVLVMKNTSVALLTSIFSFILAAPIMCLSAADHNDFEGFIEFELELTSLNLSGGPFAIPLASDPANVLGDSIDGYGFVDSVVSLTLSSQRAINPGPQSLGTTLAVTDSNTTTDLLAINPGDLDGQTFFVNSFFDVFFDITLTDVDTRPGRDYAGQPNGASVALTDNGPTSLFSSYEATFDQDAPNFGLLPPAEDDPLLGFFQVEIPLGGDINGNGEDDKMKFVLAILSIGDENRSFIDLPDGTVINLFDTAAVLEGAIVDVSTDPPFTIGAMLPSGLPDPGAFGGPTASSSNLLNPVTSPPAVPVPAAVWLFGTGIIGLIGFSRRRKAA